jgi:aminoglycoside phosphotransferase (APT) family kinase protein
VNEPGPLLAGGRSADIYDAGPGRVLRRRRGGPIDAHEVAAMRVAHAHGFPVPEVFDVDGADMTMERIDGTDYLSILARRPWRARPIGRMLADLHRRLAEVPVEGLEIRTRGEAAEALVHGDLHPGNVLVGRSGPVVIDWENACAGPRDADVASTWILLSIADVDDVSPLIRPAVSRIRRRLIRSFLAGVDASSPATIRGVCDFRLSDTNLRPHERDRVREFRARHGGAGQAASAP